MENENQKNISNENLENTKAPQKVLNENEDLRKGIRELKIQNYIDGGELIALSDILKTNLEELQKKPQKIIPEFDKKDQNTIDLVLHTYKNDKKNLFKTINLVTKKFKVSRSQSNDLVCNILFDKGLISKEEVDKEKKRTNIVSKITTIILIIIPIYILLHFLFLK